MQCAYGLDAAAVGRAGGKRLGSQAGTRPERAGHEDACCTHPTGAGRERRVMTSSSGHNGHDVLHLVQGNATGYVMLFPIAE